LQNRFCLLATSYESLVRATLLHGAETDDNQKSWRWHTTDSRGETRNVLKDMITSKGIRRWPLVTDQKMLETIIRNQTSKKMSRLFGHIQT